MRRRACTRRSSTATCGCGSPWPARDTLIVLDYRGVPYLRFTRAGVEVNKRSEMYYLNATPYRGPRPRACSAVRNGVRELSGRRAHYEWHDGSAVAP